MGKSIRCKAHKQWRAQRREKLADWERQRTQDMYESLMNDVAAQDSQMKDAREALSVPTGNVPVKREVTIEIEDEADSDVRMLSVEPRIQKKKSTPRRAARAHASK